MTGATPASAASWCRWGSGPVVAEFGEDLGGVDGSTAREALDERAIGVLGQSGRDRRRELLDLGAEGRENRDQGLDEFAAGLGLGVAGATDRGAAESGQQLGRRAAAAVGMPTEEQRQAALAQALGALGRGVAREEGERDRGIHVGKMVAAPGRSARGGRGAGWRGRRAGRRGHRGRGPGRGGRGSHRRGAARGGSGGHRSGAGRRASRRRRGRSCRRGRVAGAAGLHGIGMDRDDREAGVQEGIDDEAGGALEGDGQRGGGRERASRWTSSAKPAACGAPSRASGRCRSRRAHKPRAWWRPSPSRRRRTLRASLGLRDTAAGEVLPVAH